ncbi:MAG: hypothetical protein PHF00_08765 [Elusimicrobia bacterium]|nr:hypothetical protein [Elusimicrobiota bacterium]
MTCAQENKDTAKICKKCGRDLTVPPAWFPDARWHLKVLGLIYVALIAAYFGVSFLLRSLPKPYHIRQIPPEMTPWLRHGPKFLPEDQLKAPPPPPSEAPARK